MKTLIQKIRTVFGLAKTIEQPVERWFWKAEETMKEKAERIIDEVHRYEHEQTMRCYSLIQNVALLIFVLILVLSFGNLFLLCLLAFWSSPTKKY